MYGKPEKVSASLKDGMLVLHVPKRKKPHRDALESANTVSFPKAGRNLGEVDHRPRQQLLPTTHLYYLSR
jgi:hypothetical protein